MPTFATGVAKTVAIAQEATEGVNPVTGGQFLRRVSSDLALNKDTYESQEILVSQQIRDARHGVRRPQGTFAGQISPGSFSHFWQGILRNDFTAGVSISGTFTLAHAAGTLTLTAGGLIAAGFMQNDIVRITGITGTNTALNGANIRINTLTDTVITSSDITAITGLVDGSLSGITLAVAGAKVLMPPTGHLYKSYTIEHFFSDVGISEAFVGCKFGQTAIALPATGLVTFNSQVIGINMVQTNAQQLTSPAATNAYNSLAAVNGVLRFDNTDQAVVTGMNIQLNGALGADPVVGSNIVPHIFQGRFRVSGNMTALFEDETIADTFFNEIEVEVSLMLTLGSGPGADFMRFTMPRVKLMGATKSDSDMALIQNFNFTALENVPSANVATADPSTFIIQDSTVTGPVTLMAETIPAEAAGGAPGGSGSVEMMAGATSGAGEPPRGAARMWN